MIYRQFRIQELADDVDDAGGHFAVQFVVGREDGDFVVGKLLCQLVIGRSGLDAQGFGFVRACDDAAVVVGQHDDGFVFQVGTKDALAGNVAVVAVDDAVHRRRGWGIEKEGAQGSHFLKGAYEVDDDSPDFEVVVFGNLENGEVGIGGLQFVVAVVLMLEVEVFHGEVAVEKTDDDGAVVGFDGAVDDDAVAVEDAGILHRHTFHLAIEGGFGMAYVVAVEVEGFVGIVVGRRGKSGNDACVLQFQLGVEDASDDLYVSHAVR